MLVRLNHFFAEVKRRKVHRTAGAYLVVAIMTLEGADLVLPAMGVSPSTYRVLVFFVVSLFPVFLVFSWVYDVTGHGLIRTPNSHAPLGSERDSVRPGDGAADPPIGMGAPTAVAAQPPVEHKGKAELIDSLAILPFRAGGEHPDDVYLSEGIAESIINRMSGLSGLRVVPRSSSFRYGGPDLDLAQVGEELRVRALVTGSVHHRGTNLVVQAELVDVAWQSQLWGEHYSRPMEDVFDVQEEMAKEIYRALSQTLSKEDEAVLKQRDTQDPEAYQEYLKGRYHWNRRTAEGFRAATHHFREAIGLDPGYAKAYAGLADTYNVLGYYSIQAPTESYPPAKVAAEKALDINPSLAEAHASLGYATLFYDRDWEGAARHFQAAIERDPDYASAHQWYAWYYMVVGRFDDVLACLQEAHRLDPLSLIINDHLAYGYLLAGRADEVRGQIRKTQGLSPDYPLAWWRLGNYQMSLGAIDEAIEAYERAASITDGRLCLGYLGKAMAEGGDTDGANAILTRLEADSEHRYVSPLDRALVHAGLGDLDETFRWLDAALVDRVSDLVRLRLLPWPEAVIADPRFGDMVRRLGLP